MFGLYESLEAAIVAMTVVVIVVGAVYDIPRTLQFGPLAPSISFKKCLRLALRCLPIVLASIAAALASSIPRQYLVGVQGEATLGIYAAAAAPVALIQTGASYIYNPLLGYFSESFAARDRKGFNALLTKATVGIVVLGLVCAIGVMVLGEPVLVLVYGKKMSGFSYLLSPLVALAMLTGYMWFVNDLLMAIRNFRGAFVGNVAALISSLCALPLIGLYSMDGVTYVCFISAFCGIGFMATALVIQLKGYWK